ncbi:hypothetical protein [Rhodanobacter sp. A1T4]|uniref:hypothetical protein n=1 Tax=Rhodanobacter sp. A1T4 TaxID=2723087 RepID=UPI00160C85D6|nr:hypothetical protein [Rhodanobacter sp. A1T4]MBB6247740.1 hypothetical protein [Rhodanobacter sp. A1T4]
MEQLRSYADDRLISGCVYCGGPEETREHVPSRVFLDKPLPENLPVLGACWSCNNGFSKDEEYVACLIASVIAGSTDPDQIGRPAVANILRRTPALRARIESAKCDQNGRTQFGVEPDRVRNIVLKLARGHAAFELGLPVREEPNSLWWHPLELMAKDERDSFDACEMVRIFGEVGSRGLQRLQVAQLTLQPADGQMSTLELLINDWVNVQDERYRYLAIDDGDEVRIKFIISEYLACQVTWTS